MNAQKMLRLCKTAANQLDDLGHLLAYIPEEHGATQFVFETPAELHELKHIAKYETTRAMTVEQAAHIQRILARIAFFMSLVPDNVKDSDA